MKKVLGAHFSTSSGLRYVAVSARGLGVNAAQMFLGVPYSWHPYKLTSDSISEFKRLSYGLAIYVHLPYTINPCEVNEAGLLRSISLASALRYLELSMEVGARSIVLHPGYKKSLSVKEARVNLISFIKVLLDQKLDLRILLEVDSGSKNGSKVGSIEFLDTVVDSLCGDVGICLDTEHMYARGVDIWEPCILDSILTLYGSKIELVHLNSPDKEVELGSYLDRHNSTFASSSLDSHYLISTLVGRYPSIIERKSLVVSEEDISHINSIV